MDGKTGSKTSPTLFNILIAAIEEEMTKVKWREIRLGEKRIYSLQYVDDVVLMVKKEGEMKNMLEKLERYLDRKGLELKIARLKVGGEGGGKMSKMSWW